MVFWMRWWWPLSHFNWMHYQMIGSETEDAHVWQQESRPVAAQLSTQNKPNSLAIVWQEERERESMALFKPQVCMFNMPIHTWPKRGLIQFNSMLLYSTLHNISHPKAATKNTSSQWASQRRQRKRKTSLRCLCRREKKKLQKNKVFKHAEMLIWAQVLQTYINKNVLPG